MTMVFFRNVFYECTKGKSLEHLLIIGDVYWQWLDGRLDDHVYRKTIAKALDINDIIEKYLGMSARWLQIFK